MPPSWTLLQMNAIETRTACICAMDTSSHASWRSLPPTTGQKTAMFTSRTGTTLSWEETSKDFSSPSTPQTQARTTIKNPRTTHTEPETSDITISADDAQNYRSIDPSHPPSSRRAEYNIDTIENLRLKTCTLNSRSLK